MLGQRLTASQTRFAFWSSGPLQAVNRATFPELGLGYNWLLHLRICMASGRSPGALPEREKYGCSAATGG